MINFYFCNIMEQFHQKKNNQKGAIATFLTLLILGAILLIALGLSNIFIEEIKTSGYIRQSAAAFYAADAGAEYALYQISKSTSLPASGSAHIDLTTAGSRVDVTWSYADPGEKKIESTGQYVTTNRKVKIEWN